MFAIANLVTIVGSAVYDLASLIWMELSLILVALLTYTLFIGGVPWVSVNRDKKLSSASAGDAAEQKLGELHGRGDYLGVLRLWERAKGSEAAASFDLASVVDAMSKVGRSSAEIMAELQSALAKNPILIEGVAVMPTKLLRDDAAELLEGVVQLLEERGGKVDIAVYAGLMAAQLRRRNFTGVALSASRLPPTSLTAKMRSTLAAAAAHRGRLDESLGHLRQMPDPVDGARALPVSTITQILTIATQENNVSTAAEELQRLRGRLESRHLDTIINTVGRKHGPAAVRELLNAGIVLQVPKTVVGFRVLAALVTETGDSVEMCLLLDELEVELRLGPQGISLGEPLASVLFGACKAVGDASFVLRVVELYNQTCTGGPGVRVLCGACGALLAIEHPEAACDLYEKEFLPRRLWGGSALVSAMVKAAEQIDRAALVERLQDSSVCATANVACNSETSRQACMIQACTRERDLNGAISIFEKFQQSGSPLSPLICNCLLEAYVQCGDLQGTEAHFEEMKKIDCVDVVSCNTVLKAYLATGATAKADELICEMDSRGLQANKVTYNELLHAKVVARDSHGISQLLDKMTAAGVKANSVTCSILLKSLTVHSSTKEVQRVTDLIGDVEEQIDEVLFSSVIEACTRIKQLSPLSDLMKRRHRCKPVKLSSPTYGSMIKAYGQAGDITRVRELWEEMREQNVKPTAITFGCMAEALVANGQADEAWDLIQNQTDTEHRGCINTVIYSTVLKGFAVARRIEKVFSAYEEMKEKRIPCNTITYNTMLDACAKCCAMDRASALLEDMKCARVEPDIITYSTIVKGYCVEGDVDRAFSMLEDMKSDGKFAPDEIMYNSILDGCATQHRVDDALKILAEMQTVGVGPSNYTLSILVKLLGHARRLNQAFTMVDELSYKNDFRPNVQVYTCLVQACIMNRRLERAMHLHDTMVADTSCVVDDKFYAVLARGCLQMHQPMKAMDVVRAAYQLPGCSLKLPVKSSLVVGVDLRSFEEIVARLKVNGADEQRALTALAADLLEYRGIDMYHLPTHTVGRNTKPQNRRGGRGRVQ